jgi:ribose 5-phosphate isomerase B
VRVIVGSALKGLELKTAIASHLAARGHEVVDVGCREGDAFVKYTAIGQRIAEGLYAGRGELAVSCCGSGTGASLAAGKFRGVCAVSCESVATARLIRVVNGANCLCLGEDVLTPRLAREMVDAFLAAEFQDAPGVAPPVLAFWREAREELLARGPVPEPRAVETLEERSAP